MHLDHINGVSDDHRFENLQILCPNCHSQTETYSGKRNKILKDCKKCNKAITKHSNTDHCVSCTNKIRSFGLRKVVRPEKDVLLGELAVTSFVQIGKKYGVSDTSIRKWCRAYGLPTKPEEIKKLWNEKQDESNK